jgi:MarC family membrane protein
MVLELIGAPGETSTRTMRSSLAPDADAGGEVVLQEILTDSRPSVWPSGAFSVSILLTRIHDFAAIVFIAVAAMLPIVDPLGGTPIYLAMISGLMPPERARMAKLVALNSFLLLLASMLTGAYVLHFFGISIPALQVAGGLVVCAIAWSLLNRPGTPAASARPDSTTRESLTQRAFYPLTMPLTIGPGAISVAVTLGADPAAGPERTAGHDAGARDRRADYCGGNFPLLSICVSPGRQARIDGYADSCPADCVHHARDRHPDRLEWRPHDARVGASAHNGLLTPGRP